MTLALVATTTPAFADVQRALAPFKEYDGPGSVVSEHLSFFDEEDAARQRWESDTYDLWRKPGTEEFVVRYDRRFRIPGTLGFDDTTHKHPSAFGYVEEKVPVSRLWPNLDAYIADTVESPVDETTGRHGYWHNPNGRWTEVHICPPQIMLPIDGTMSVPQARVGAVYWPRLDLPSVLVTKAGWNDAPTQDDLRNLDPDLWLTGVMLF